MVAQEAYLTPLRARDRIGCALLGHCIKVTLLSGSREQMENLPFVLRRCNQSRPKTCCQHFFPRHKLPSFHFCPSNDRLTEFPVTYANIA